MSRADRGDLIYHGGLNRRTLSCYSCVFADVKYALQSWLIGIIKQGRDGVVSYANVSVLSWTYDRSKRLAEQRRVDELQLPLPRVCPSSFALHSAHTD